MQTDPAQIDLSHPSRTSKSHTIHPRTPPALLGNTNIEFDVDMESLKSQKQTPNPAMQVVTPSSHDLQLCFESEDINDILRSDTHIMSSIEQTSLRPPIFSKDQEIERSSDDF